MSDAGADADTRREWAVHLEDEARAIALQQAAAGVRHEPMAGPLPFSQDDVTAAVRAAVAAERERCARVAASFAVDAKLLQLLPTAGREQREAAAWVARRIAQALRAGEY